MFSFLRRSKLPSSFTRILKKYGDVVVRRITICRKPIQKEISTLMNVLTAGEVRKKLDAAKYEDFYHLSAYLHTDKGVFILEKNEILRFAEVAGEAAGSNCQTIIVAANITMANLVNNTIKAMGEDRFVSYSARKNNCQDLVLNLLRANGLNTPENEQFVKQDAEALIFADNPKIEQLTDALTGVAAEVSSTIDDLKTLPHNVADEVSAAANTVKDAVGDFAEKGVITGASWAQKLSPFARRGDRIAKFILPSAT